VAPNVKVQRARAEALDEPKTPVARAPLQPLVRLHPLATATLAPTHLPPNPPRPSPTPRTGDLARTTTCPAVVCGPTGRRCRRHPRQPHLHHCPL